MDDDLTAIAEAILCDYDPHDRPDDLELVERPDLLMWTRPSPSKWSSTVRLARWSEAEVDPRIDEVLAFFGARGRPFVWHVGPSSTPSDLGLRLERRGFVREAETRLLIARLPVEGLRVSADVRIVDARGSGDVEELLRFGHPDAKVILNAAGADDVREEIATGVR